MSRKSLGYIRGADVYPYAPDWRWVRKDGRWVEANKPDPVYTMVYFPPKPKYRVEDYPGAGKAVARANRMSDIHAFRPLALGTAKPKHSYETEQIIERGKDALSNYDANREKYLELAEKRRWTPARN